MLSAVNLKIVIYGRAEYILGLDDSKEEIDFAFASAAVCEIPNVVYFFLKPIRQ